MARYLINRLWQGLLVLWATFTIAFILLQALPGDAVMLKFLRPEYGLNQQQLAEIMQSYGSETSFLQKYVTTLFDFLRGDFGHSVENGVPVSALIASSLPGTLILALMGFVGAVILASAVALLSTFAPFQWLRRLFASLPPLFASVPVFWVGIMLIQIFSFRLKWVSVIGAGPLEARILPALTLSIVISAALAQVLMRNIDDTSVQPFVSVARAKGASFRWAFWHHILRNTLVPTLAIAGVLFGELLAGAVVTETVFGLNGIGVLTINAVNNQDVAVLEAIVVISAVIFVAITLLIDLVAPLIDPRLRAAKGA
ncbi:Inner membrane ABC transporter, putative [Ketogulonicigenium robustum]|uniref:Inner membrane ABC transporter, putative n=1 Tax=Ketogulonicigenium robustum TaxID=92947 RepID=A0A1W6NYT5_9RHOB|nr:ABC transporter permease [Ketogulonicigenium robustum]ARO14374.1 Inner membrane ABC transporter, putative [Ketogulonicigenium robustum]